MNSGDQGFPSKQYYSQQSTVYPPPTKKSRNETSRCGSVAIEELAEIISASISDMSTCVTPDKRAILQETVQKFKRLREEGSAANNKEPVQQGDVSSSRPSALADDVLGPLLLEALDGFLFVVNRLGVIVFVSGNISEYLNYNQSDLVGKNIYTIVHSSDHVKFNNCLLPLSADGSIGWSTESGGTASKNQVFNCRMLIKPGGKNSIDLTAGQHVSIQISAVLQEYPCEKDSDIKDKQSCLVCVARRGSSGGSMLGIEQFTTKLDLNGKVVACDTSNITLSNYHPGEFVGQNIKDFCHVNDGQNITKHLQEVLKSGTNISMVYRFKLQENRYVFVQTKSELYNNANNEAGYIMSTHSIVRECDSDVELKGSASTSLMKSIIQSNNTNAAGTMPPSGYMRTGYGRSRRPSSVSSVSNMDMNSTTDMNLNDVLGMPSNNWDVYNDAPAWSAIPSVNLSHGQSHVTNQPPGYLARQNSMGSYNNVARSPGYSSGQRSPAFAGGRSPSYNNPNQYPGGRGSPYGMNRRTSSTSSVGGMARTPGSGYPPTSSPGATTPMDALRNMEVRAGMPTQHDKLRQLCMRQASKEGIKPQNSLRRLLSGDKDEDDMPDSSRKGQLSPQPGPGQDQPQPQADPDSNTKESMSPTSSKGKNSSSVLKSLLSEDEEGLESKSGEANKGNEAEPKKADNMLLKRLLNDTNELIEKKEKCTIMQKLLSEEDQSAEITSQQMGDSQQAPRIKSEQLTNVGHVDSTQNPFSNNNDSFINDLLSTPSGGQLPLQDRELDSYLSNLWEKQTQQQEMKSVTKRKMSTTDMADSTENMDMEPTTSSGANQKPSVLLTELLTKNRQSIQSASVGGGTNPAGMPKLPTPVNIVDFNPAPNGLPDALLSEDMQQASRTANLRDNPRTNPNTPFPGNTNGQPTGQVNQSNTNTGQPAGGMQQMYHQPMDIGGMGDNPDFIPQQDFNSNLDDAQLLAQIQQALDTSDVTEIDNLLGIGGNTHPSDPNEQMAIDAIQRQLMGEADHASNQYLQPMDSLGAMSSATTTASSDNMSLGRMRQMSQMSVGPPHPTVDMAPAPALQPPPPAQQRFNQTRFPQQPPQAQMRMSGMSGQFSTGFHGGASSNMPQHVRLMQQQQQRKMLMEHKRMTEMRKQRTLMQQQYQQAGGIVQQQSSSLDLVDMDAGFQGNGSFAESFADLMNSGTVPPNVTLPRSGNMYNQSAMGGGMMNQPSGQPPFQPQQQWPQQQQPSQPLQQRQRQAMLQQQQSLPGQSSQFMGNMPQQRPQHSMMTSQGNMFSNQPDPVMHMFNKQQQMQQQQQQHQQQQRQHMNQQIRQQMMQRMSMPPNSAAGRGTSPRGPQSPYGSTGQDPMLISPNQQPTSRTSPYATSSAPNYNVSTSSYNTNSSFDQDIGFFGMTAQDSMSLPMSSSSGMMNAGGSTSQYVKNELRSVVSARAQPTANPMAMANQRPLQQAPPPPTNPLSVLDAEIPDDLLDQLDELKKDQELQQQAQQHQQQQQQQQKQQQQGPPRQGPPQPHSVGYGMPSTSPTKITPLSTDVLTQQREEARMRYQQLHNLSHVDSDEVSPASNLFRSQLSSPKGPGKEDQAQSTTKKRAPAPPKVDIPTSVSVVQVGPRTPIDDIKPADQRNSLLQQLLSE